ncbi:MAG: hypothetical protein AAGH89_19215, partial [Verrucomicrobiota bacterium]
MSSNLTKERAALSGSDALLSDLVRQRGDAKICYDDEDGWFVQFQWCHHENEWKTLEFDQERHASPTAAIRGAVLAHNEEIHHRQKNGLAKIHYIIPSNQPMSEPNKPTNGLLSVWNADRKLEVLEHKYYSN